MFKVVLSKSSWKKLSENNKFINHNILVKVYLFYPKDEIVMQGSTDLFEELS